MIEKTPCEEMDYKVGDEFIIQKDACGFVKGQAVKLYMDDGSSVPLFQGPNNLYNLCDGQEGAYLDLDSVTKVVKEEKGMKSEAFNLKTNPWFIRVANEQEYNAARDWVKENFGDYLDIGYSSDKKGLSNTKDCGETCTRAMWMGEESFNETKRHEIKLIFKTTVDSVTFPEVKTEQQKQIEELEATIVQAQTQIAQLKQQINKGE